MTTPTFLLGRVSPEEMSPRELLNVFIPVTNQTCTDSITTFLYDETGQPTSETDPNGNATTYSYLDSYSGGNPAVNTNAYLTKITHPQTNGVSHIESFSYAQSDGVLTVTVDENDNHTTYHYDDPLRLD